MSALRRRRARRRHDVALAPGLRASSGDTLKPWTAVSAVVDYRFRARLPAEAGYPFPRAVSRVVRVRVTGR